MKTKIEIGTKVMGAKGLGVITKVITKSTGYVVVNYNGFEKKEMAFNLTDENGVALKSKKSDKSAEKLHVKLSITAHSNGFFVNADGTTDYEGREAFLEEMERKNYNSISW